MKKLLTYSVKTKLVIVVIIGTLFIALFFLLNVLFQQYKKQETNKTALVNELQSQIILLKAQEDALLTELINNNDLLFLNADNHLVKLENNYLKTIVYVDSLLEIDFIASDSVWTDNIVTIKTYLDELYYQYEDLIINYKKRGTINHNMVKQWNKLGNDIENLVYEINEPEVLIEINNLRKLEKLYLINPESETMGQITVNVKSIQSVIGFMHPEYQSKINKMATEYINLANEITIIDQRIGIGTYNGLRQQLNLVYKKVNSYLHDVNNHISQNTKERVKTAKNILLTLYVLLSLFYLIIVLIISNSIIVPLLRANDYLSKLTKGELPSRFDMDIKGEMNVFINRLNHLVYSLKEKKDFAIQLSNNNLDQELALKSRKDILGKALISLQNNLKSSQDEHEKFQQENRLRQYINEGLARISGILQQYNNDLDKLSIELIRELVKYLEIVQGALYLVITDENQQEVIELTGVYAYDRQKYMTKTIQFGQGLVGTCALEKKPIKPKKLPDDYIYITSGLGDSPPNHLFLMPVINEDKLEGVIELAGLKDFEDYQIELIKAIANALGTALSSIRMNDQTSELLKKSQQQASEMAEQEEEMRQNMEELQATQEEASRREEETINLLDAYHKTVMVIDYELNGTIINISDNYCHFLSVDKNKIIGQIHGKLFGIHSESENEVKLWSSLKSGDKQVRVEQYTTANQEVKWLYQLYTPVYNNANQVHKVVNIAFDITEQKNNEISMHAKEESMKHEKFELNMLNKMIEQSIARADFSEQGQLMDFNKNFLRLIGHEADEIKDKVYSEYLNKVEIEKFDNIWANLIQTQKPISTIFRRTKPNGENVWISATFHAVLTSKNNQIDRIIMFGTNITENIQRITR